MAADTKLYLLLTSNHSLVEEEEEEEELLLAVINPHISPPDFSSILQWRTIGDKFSHVSYS